MITLSADAPAIVIDLSMSMSSSKVPAQTVTTPPAGAASMASWIVSKPPAPATVTQNCSTELSSSSVWQSAATWEQARPTTSRAKRGPGDGREALARMKAPRSTAEAREV